MYYLGWLVVGRVSASMARTHATTRTGLLDDHRGLLSRHLHGPRLDLCGEKVWTGPLQAFF